MALQDEFGPSLWTNQKIEVPASSSVNTREILLTNFRKIKYVMVFYNSTKTKSLEINVINENGSLRDSVFARLGSMSIQVDTEINSGKMSVKITNNETVDVITDIAYLILGSN